MTTAAPAPEDVLEKVDALGPPGTPVTTPEVAEGFDCTQRTIYNRLEALVDEEILKTKKVGANSRVWWRPVDGDVRRNGGASDRRDPVVLRNGQTLSIPSDSEMAERIREFEWAETPIGPIDEWPTELQVAVEVMLGASTPIGVYWGEDLTLLYNDPARGVIGEKHPDALGQPARDVFSEAWDTLSPIHGKVMAGDGATRLDQFLLPLERADEIEDIWWDSSYSPIPLADGSIGGVFNTAIDVTDRVQAEQDLRETNERLQVALNAAGMGTWEWDLEARTVRGDDIMLSLFDLPPTDDPVPVERFLEKESAAGVAQAEDAMDTSFEPGEEIQDEFHLEHGDTDRWISWRARASDDDPSVLLGVSYDITERKERERERQKQADLDAFRIELTDAIRPLTDPVEIQHEAARVVGEYLDVDRAHYGEVLADGDTNVVHADYYRRDVSSVVGEYQLSDFGDILLEKLRAGEPMAIDDIATMPRLSDDERAGYIDHEVRAWMSAPLLKEGNLIGYFSVTQSTPREWTESEILMIEETAQRTWAAVERGRAEQELRESEERYHRLFDSLNESINEGFCIVEVLSGESESVEYRFVEANPAFEELTGLTDVVGERVGDLALDGEPPGFEVCEEVAQTGESRRIETTAEPLKDGWYDVHVFPYGEPNSGKVALLIDDITERKEAEQNLRESERRYRTVLNSMDEGFFLADVVFDSDGEPLDIFYRDSNPAAVEMVGEEFEGRWLTEIDMSYEEYWYEVFGRVASTGEGERHELYAEPDGIWYNFYVFKPEGAGPRRVAVVFEDITERKEAERELQHQAELDAFRVDLTDAIRSLSDPEDIQLEAARVLGEELDVDRANYGEVLADENTNVVHTDYYRGDVSSIAGRHHLDDYGSYIPEAFRAGETVVIDDFSTIEELSDEERAIYDEAEIAAWIGVPLVKDDRLVAYFVVNASTPREWTDTEVDMVEETAERTWAAVERAQAEGELAAELEAVKRLQEVSTLSIQPDDGGAMYDTVLDTATDLLDAEFGSLQRLDPEANELELLANQGFTEEAESPWERNTIEDASTCGKALQAEERVVVSDVETSEFMAGTADQETYLQTGIRAVQTTPLVSRDGDVLGMFSTHWSEPHEPSERDLHLLDVLARQVADLMQQRSTIEALRESQERLDSFVTATSEVVYRMSPDWSEMYYLDGKDFVADTEEPRETWLEEYIPPDEEKRVMEAIEEAIETTSTFELEHQVVQADGTRGWVHARAAPVLDDAAEIVEWFGTSTDITERKRAEQRVRESEATLARLNAATQTLIDADTATIADRIAPLVRDVLDVEYAALWQYDDRSGNLEEHAADVASSLDTEAVAFPTEIAERAWETFVGTDIDVENDSDVPTDATTPLRSHAFVPLSRHGVVFLGSTQAHTFDKRTVDLVETVTATVETAWNRAAGEEELARRNEELTRLDRLNTLIREIDQALVAADTREEIDEVVCERLADSDLYEFAWIGDHDPGTGVVEPRAWAGVDSGYLEDLTITVADTPTNRDPIARAVRTGDLQVVSDIATDSDFAPWREATLERGARSLVCIPLVYDDAAYGVLTVYADQPQSNEDERNQQVLSELGDTIAHTINARETRATLQTDSIVELTLRFEDADTPLCRLTQETECTIDYQGFVPRSNGQVDVFYIARGISPEELQATAAQLLVFDDLDCLTEGADGSLFRARVSDPPLAARVTDDGAVVRSITIDAGVATAALDVSHTVAVREFMDRLRQWNPNFELRARQSRERPLKTRQTFVTALEDQLTDRQREVLQTAYLSGYFEMPRVSNGQEVTELLGVSQPTFSEHLRAAERTLCEVLFEPESYADDVGSV